MKLAFFAILLNEEETVADMLDCVVGLGDVVEVCSIVDNGSYDDTLDIVWEYRDKLPLVVQHEREHSHHGHLRTLALEPCRGKAPWILYADSDETWTTNFREWLLTGECERADIWDFFKFFPLVDRFHTYNSGNGPCTRMFRNTPDVHFPQNVHTYPISRYLRTKALCRSVVFFDNQHLMSREYLWAKGWRYQVHKGTPSVGGPREYINRRENAMRHPENIVEIPRELWPLIRT